MVSEQRKKEMSMLKTTTETAMKYLKKYLSSLVQSTKNSDVFCKCISNTCIFLIVVHS